MSFFQLVRREMHGSLRRLAFVSSMGGISTTSILAAINSGTQSADQGYANLWAGLLFVVALLLFIQTQHYLLITTTAEIEAIIHRVRVRLMNYVRQSDLLPLEAIGRAEIVSAITRETTTLTLASNALAFAAQGALLIILVTLYVAYLSLLAFALTIVIVGTGAILFHSKTRRLAIEMREASKWETRLYERLNDLLDGFKEIRLNRARSDELFADIVEVSRSAANIKIRTQSETYKRMVLLQSSLYTLLGAVTFVVPSLSPSGSVTKIVTALIFIVAACFGLVQAIPVVAAANGAADKIDQLETKLKQIANAEPVEDVVPRKSFQTIEMRDVEFRYVDRWSDAAFKVGPFNFLLKSGDLVFITGGNGSGKSTFMKLLAGFYRPDSGSILLDGEVVTEHNIESFRSLIAAIFPDFHLFQRLYGISELDQAELQRLLSLFRLTDKTRVADGEFSTVDLSSGQRRRLALTVSLLETRPLMLLDEWAADQDPEFRRKFYFDLLPELNRAGLTIVAISHDDRYIDEMRIPARRLHMDEGRFTEHKQVELNR